MSNPEEKERCLLLMTVICCPCCSPLSKSLHLVWAIFSQINGSMSPEGCKWAGPSADVSQSKLGLRDYRSTWTAEIEARESSRWQPRKDLLVLNCSFLLREHIKPHPKKEQRTTEKQRGVWELVTLVYWIFHLWVLLMLRNIIKPFLFCLLWKKKTNSKTKDKSRGKRQKKLKGMENVSCHLRQELRVWQCSGDMKWLGQRAASQQMW